MLGIAVLALVSVQAVNYNVGEADWASLCKTGATQSPIDIDKVEDVENPEQFQFKWYFTNSAAGKVTYTVADNKIEFYNTDSSLFGYVDAY
jgi:carbonic anhydrase